MIFNTILALVSLVITIWIAVRGFTLGWTTDRIVLLFLGLLNIAARLDAIRRERRQSVSHRHSADDSPRV
jgi:hypothetical protein